MLCSIFQVAPQAVIQDIDSTLASNLSVTIASKYPGDVYYLPSINGITLTQVQGSNQYVYSGQQSLSLYEQLIRNITFVNTNEEIEVLQPRKLYFQVFTPVSGNGATAGSNIAMATITIVTINDQPPIFSQNIYYGSVDENLPAGSPVGVTVTATDPDIPSNANITYAISGESEEFKVHPTTGVVTTRKPLDAETLPSYLTFSVVAEDSDGVTVQSSTAVVNISINDLNDNLPVFSQESYTRDLPENTTVNSIVLQVSATDNDRSSINSVITYSISSHTNLLTPDGQGSGHVGSGYQELPFVIDSKTGIIKLSQIVDYEDIKQYIFNVLATDSGSFPTQSSVAVTVNIQDINDNVPVFVNTPYIAAVSETASIGTSILTVQAVDADYGSNSEITYSLVGTDLFTINTTSGQISVLAPLDHEATRYNVFTVIAHDGGHISLSSEATVNISFVNENDNPPIFSHSIYSFSFPENTQFEFSVYASDLDNNILSYSIINACSDNTFTIDTLNGRIFTTKELDRETTPICNLTVEVTDGQFSDVTIVSIAVKDENDNTPTFTQDLYEATISEISPPGTFVHQVIANDLDAGANGTVTYEIVGGNLGGAFAISPSQGVVNVTLSLDYDTVNKFNLTIVAKDGGQPSLTSSTHLVITLTDHNDVSPALFLAQNQIMYTEQSGIVTIASNIQVIDPDTSPLQQATIIFSVNGCQGNFDNIPKTCPNDLVCYWLCGEALILNQTLLSSIQVSHYIGEHEIHVNLTGEALTTKYQSILSSLAYTNIADEPSTDFRVIEIAVNDGVHYSNVLAINITIIFVDDHCPIITAFYTNNLNYTEEMTALNLGQNMGLVLSDPDRPPHQTLSGMTITMNELRDGEFENLTMNATDLPLSVSTSSHMDSIIITILGDTPIQTYNTLLHTLSYSNSLPEPTPGVRSITIVPIKGTLVCAVLTATINVKLINDNPPIINLINTSIILYEEENGLLAFAEIAGLQITDEDQDFPLQSATIMLEGVQDNNYESLIFNSLSLLNGVSISNNTTTSITFTGSGSIAAYQSIIRSIYYINTAAEPTPGNREISVTIYDGEHDAVKVIIIIVVLANDNPLQLTPTIVRFTYYEGNTSIPIGGLTLYDPDQDAFVSNLTISLSSLETNIETISVMAFGNIISDASSITISQSAPVSTYQVCINI